MPGNFYFYPKPLKTAVRCGEGTDGGRTERMALGTDCLHFTSPRSKEISAHPYKVNYIMDV